ncbi:unnamed protein product, partial [Amoebophrya sp. A120]|eukprot:GSA120T00015432001.1
MKFAFSWLPLHILCRCRKKCKRKGTYLCKYNCPLEEIFGVVVDAACRDKVVVPMALHSSITMRVFAKDMLPLAPAVPNTLRSRRCPCCLVLASLLLCLHDGPVSVTALSQQRVLVKKWKMVKKRAAARREQKAVDAGYDEQPASALVAPKTSHSTAHYDHDPHRDQRLHTGRWSSFFDMGQSSVETSGKPLHLQQQIESQGVRVPFFVYDNHELTMNNWTHVCVTERDCADVSLLQALRKHPWRTASPEDAEIFVVPTQFLQSRQLDEKRKTGGGKNRGHDRRTRTALNWLFTQSPWFRRRQGRDHLLLANPWYFSRLTTDERDKCIPKDAWPALSETILTREEVVHMSSWENSFKRGPKAWWRHPQNLFSVPWESTKRSVVTPIEMYPDVQVVPAEFTPAWKNRQHLIFYHTRKPASYHLGDLQAMEFVASAPIQIEVLSREKTFIFVFLLPVFLGGMKK